jgi:hypothetical protein
MRRSTGISLAAATVMIGSVVFTGTATASDDHEPEGTTLRFDAQLSSLSPATFGQNGLHPGDEVVVTEALTQDGRSLGHDAIHCVVVTEADILCTGVLVLAGGDVAIQGELTSFAPGPFSVAAVGGTGRFTGASGVLEGNQVSLTEAHDILRLQQ